MSKPRILLQLDPDVHASVFDAVVAVDAGVEHLLQYRGVTVDQVVAETGFELIISAEIGKSRAPSAEELHLLRNVVDRQRLYI